MGVTGPEFTADLSDEQAATALKQAWKDGTPPGAVDLERIPADQPPGVKIAQP